MINALNQPLTTDHLSETRLFHPYVAPRRMGRRRA